MVLDWLSGLPPVTLLQQSGTAYLIINAAHIAAFATLLGAIVALDLRILGLGRQVSLAPVGHYLSRVAAVGLAVAIALGFWLFLTQPAEYLPNRPFLIKLALIGLGILNALWLGRRAAWRAVLSGAAPSTSVRLHAFVSLLIWLSVVLAGRWIAFV